MTVRAVGLEDRHAVNRAAFLFGQRIDDIVRAEDERDIGRTEVAVDVVHLRTWS